MSLTLILVLFGLIKLPIAAMMLVLPFRNDAAVETQPSSSSADDDGGARVPPHGGEGPSPRRPTSGLPTGPHGATAIRAPRRRGEHSVPPPASPGRARPPQRRPALPAHR
jgi:hypothetical protein